MEVLFIIFAIMTIISLGAIVLLFIKNGEYENNKIVFIAVGMWSIFISWMNYTSLPLNYLTHSFIAILFGILALIALFLKTMKSGEDFVANIIMAISIIGGMTGLLLI
ncbi:MAG: hypothetical protein WBH44_02325 [Proteocatella sp.]